VLLGGHHGTGSKIYSYMAAFMNRFGPKKKKLGGRYLKGEGLHLLGAGEGTIILTRRFTGSWQSPCALRSKIEE
jgi:hypothetical protein